MNGYDYPLTSFDFKNFQPSSANAKGPSWKAKLKFAIDQVVKESENFDDFLMK